MEKVCRKWVPKASPDPFLIMMNSPKQPIYVPIALESKIFWKMIIKKPLKS